jgi:plasmid stability protein
MTEPSVTLTLSPAVYDELQQRAQRHHRRLEDEAAMTLTAAVSTNGLPDNLEAAIGALATFDNESLQRVSQSQPTVEDGVLLDALVDQRRRQGLSSDEEALLAQLVNRYDRVMVLRAEAVALLKGRGVDVQERVARAGARRKVGRHL